MERVDRTRVRSYSTLVKLAYSSNAYMRFPVEEAIDRIASLGFAGVELMADEPHLWPATTSLERMMTIRQRLSDRHLSVSNVNAFMMNAVQDFWHPSWIEPDAAFRQLRVQHTIDALEMAHHLGAPCITTEPGGPLPKGMTREQGMELFLGGLHEALEHAEHFDVQLLVEPEPGLLIENADQFLELAERISSPMFGLNFDVGHFYCVGDPVAETVERLQHLAGHYHFEDIAATRVHEHLIPGRGAIDFGGLTKAIRETGYQGWLTVELYPYLDDPDGAGAEALDYLKRLLPSYP